jgi:hypothetical protein
MRKLSLLAVAIVVLSVGAFGAPAGAMTLPGAGGLNAAIDTSVDPVHYYGYGYGYRGYYGGYRGYYRGYGYRGYGYRGYRRW